MYAVRRFLFFFISLEYFYSQSVNKNENIMFFYENARAKYSSGDSREIKRRLGPKEAATGENTLLFASEKWNLKEKNLIKT